MVSRVLADANLSTESVCGGLRLVSKWVTPVLPASASSASTIDRIDAIVASHPVRAELTGAADDVYPSEEWA